MTVRVISFKFGAAAPFEIAQRHLRLYEVLAQSFFGGSGTVSEPPRVVPVAAEHSLSELAFQKLLVAEAFATADKDIIIDLGGPDETDSVRHNIVMGLTLALEAFAGRNSNFSVGIFLSNPMEEDAFFASRLKTVARSARVRFLFGDGKVWGSYFDDKPPSRKKVRTALAQAKTTPLEMLERKLIRRVGFYELPRSGQKLVHFYDGQSATGEIYQILLQEISRRSRGRHFDSLAFDASHSTWFEEPVRHAALHLNLPAIAIDPSMSGFPEYLTDRTFFALPIVRTGASIRQLAQLYRSRAGGEAVEPIFWSLLSTDGDKQSGGTRLLPGEGDAPAIKLEYALRVTPTAKHLMEACGRSATQAINPEEEELAGPFGADAFWAMVLEAGIIAETPVPKTREPLGYVPNFGLMSSFNGPFIAAKIEATLKRNFGHQIAPQLAFLCPDEPHARELAKALHALAGHDTIFVDRDILDRYSLGPVQQQMLRGDSKKFKATMNDLNVKLSRIGELTRRLPQHDRPHVVLLDEFDFSGGTMRSLYNLASAFGLRTLCSISLASLSGLGVRHSPVTAYSLYDLPYPALGGRGVTKTAAG